MDNKKFLLQWFTKFLTKIMLMLLVLLLKTKLSQTSNKQMNCASQKLKTFKGVKYNHL